MKLLADIYSEEEIRQWPIPKKYLAI